MKEANPNLADTKPEKQRTSPLLLTLLASVALHIVVLIVKELPNDSLLAPVAEDQQPIELTPPPPEAKAEPPTKTKKVKIKPQETEMAETEDAKNKKLDPNAKYLSDRNQVAEKQTRAQAIDDFRQKKGSGLKSDQQKSQAMAKTGNPEDEPASKNSPVLDSKLEVLDTDKQAEAEKSKKQKKDAVAGIKRDWKTLDMKDLGIGGDGGQTSASDDKLANVDTGERTILSTREYRYFSYYQRIKELLRQYWKPNVETKLYHMWAKGQQVGEEELVTRLIVLLDTEGRIQKISRVGSSGVVDLDQAAIDAFHQAGPFPNPPKGIIEQDGFVRISWEFILKTEAAPTIQFSSAGKAPQ